MSRKYKFQHLPRPTKQGLYDPWFEHSACGVGLVANIDGAKSHRVIKQGLEVLINLGHRGASGADPETGDGAGLLIQMPHEFFLKECAKLGIALPPPSTYGVGTAFLPRDLDRRRACEAIVERVAADEGLHFLGWRDVPVSPDAIGTLAAKVQPVIRQFFVTRVDGSQDRVPLELRLYVARKQIEKGVAAADIEVGPEFYVCSLSSKKVVYKGLIMAAQLEHFYRDLGDQSMVTAFAMVHSRFSTNTLGSWELAHPYRYAIHNGEINTLRGNINWMAARQAMFSLAAVGGRRSKAGPRGRRAAERHRHAGQRGRAPSGHGSVAPPRDDDADTGGMGRPHPHGPGQKGLLRVPFVPDGALGWASAGHIHRRDKGLRHPGPKRPSPLPLSGDQGRSASHGVGDRRARCTRRERSVQVADTARPNVPAGHRGGENRRGRGDKGRTRWPAAIWPMASGQQSEHGRACLSHSR